MNFSTAALEAQFERVFNCAERLDATREESLREFNEASAKLDHSFEDAMAGLMAIARDASIKRVRAQAMNRAAINGVDPAKAADDAQKYLEAGESHETAVKLSAGEYRREVA